MISEVKIVLYPELHKSKNGTFFEQLMHSIFDQEGYTLDLNINFTGLEIDLYGKHKRRQNESLLVECKAKHKPKSTEVKNFLYNVKIAKKADFGYFLYTEKLDHQAAGLADDHKGDKDIYFFGPESIIESLVDAGKIKKFDPTIITASQNIYKQILAYTYFGIYYVIVSYQSTEKKKFHIFNATTLESVGEESLDSENNTNIKDTLISSISKLKDYEFEEIKYSGIPIPPHSQYSISANSHHQVSKSFDNWSNFIQHSSVVIDDLEYRNYNITEQLCEKIKKELDSEMVMLGRLLLRDQYDKDHITKKVFFKKYLETGMPYEEVMKLITYFVNEMAKRNKNERWEYQKNHVGSTHNENKQEKYALWALGYSNFYNIAYSNDNEISRQWYYDIVMQKMIREYGTFIDGFINAIQHSLNLIDKSPTSETYSDDFKAQFKSKFDYLLLLYLLLAKKLPSELVPRIKKYINFEKIVDLSTSEKMLDFPSIEQLRKEIEYALSDDDIED